VWELRPALDGDAVKLKNKDFPEFLGQMAKAMREEADERTTSKT
jgi:hypothetical protein